MRLKRAAEGERLKSKKKPRFPKKIPYDRQAQRLGQVFVTAERSLAAYAEGVDVALDPRAVVPERCLVFELLGDVPEFNLAAQALGLEWLATEALTDDAEEAEADEGADASDPASQPPQRLYLTMPTEQALKRLLKQWKAYASGVAYGAGQRDLWKLFGYLHSLRVWSVEDRLDPTLTAYVAKMLADDAEEDVVVELDLWYRNEAERRDASLETLNDMLDEVGGELLDQVDIPEIRYQGVLIRVPGEVAQRLADGQGRIAEFNDVMTIRPQSAYESPIEGDAVSVATELEPPHLEGDCIAALLDGYPIDQHQLLADRLHIVEVDVRGAQASAPTRVHGTAMASLIVHGDLKSPDTKPLNRPLAVLPVLVSPGAPRKEATPQGKLPIGVIYRALQTITSANQRQNPELQRVIVVNHSICDVYAPFVRRPSPWATLLDYFSHEHKLLFVVSAGNITSPFPVSVYPNIAAYQAADPDAREAAVLGAIEMSKATRTILSPAESVNSLTIGAVHADHSSPGHSAPPDPYPNFAMSSLASAVGLGVNRSVKPDFLEAGGRFAAGLTNVRGGGIEIHALPSAHYGQEVATPSPTGRLNRRMLTCGTSNAAALTTRAAHFVADALDEVYAGDRDPWHALATRAVMLKTLLAHGASWGDIGATLDQAYPPRNPKQWSPRRNTITQFLGYGQLDISRVVSGASNRITLLANDSIRSGNRHDYIVPVPPSMLNNREVRTVTITLSWTCPTTHTTADHRAVVLQLSGADNTSTIWDGVGRAGRAQPNASTANRGTLIHMVQEGKKMMTDPQGRLVIGVQAMAKVGFELDDVPYAIAITLELGQQARSQLYTEVRERVRGGRARTRVGA